MRACLFLLVPDIVLAGLMVLLLHRWAGLPAEWAIGLFAGWLLTDLATIPLFRDVFAPPSTGPETLLGARAVAEGALAPAGYVKLGGERWQARPIRPDQSIPTGARVIVRARVGLTLFVEAEPSLGAWEGASSDSPPASP
jgi:membrane protein implicated in regulation of membrane protease activity